MITNNETGPDYYDVDEDELEFEEGDFDDEFNEDYPEDVTREYDKDDEELYGSQRERIEKMLDGAADPPA